MALRPTYLVSARRTRIAASEVQELERHLNVRLPNDYHAFITTLGVGVYCDMLWVFTPRQIEAEYQSLREQWVATHHLYRNNLPVAALQARIPLAKTDDGDWLLFYPSQPEALFVLPRHDTTIYTVPQGLAAPLTWHSDQATVRTQPAFAYFEPHSDSRVQRTFSAEPADESLAALVERVLAPWTVPVTHVLDQSDTYRDTMLAFVASVGGVIRFEWERGDSSVNIWLGYDADFADEVATFVAIIDRTYAVRVWESLRLSQESLFLP